MANEERGEVDCECLSEWIDCVAAWFLRGVLLFMFYKKFAAVVLSAVLVGVVPSVVLRMWMMSVLCLMEMWRSFLLRMIFGWCGFYFCFCQCSGG